MKILTLLKNIKNINKIMFENKKLKTEVIDLMKTLVQEDLMPQFLLIEKMKKYKVID